MQNGEPLVENGAAAAQETDLDLRPGLPRPLRVLAERYPRETWQAAANLGEMARFWLARHDMFREIGGELGRMMDGFRAGTLGTEGFGRQFVPTLGFFLNQLNAHHHVEDHHYFPIFRDADPRLASGFELLDRDHATIHADLLATADAANALIRALVDQPRPDVEATLRARVPAAAAAGAGLREADAYAAASERLLRRVLRHLEDEEDLIIPLILDRGEGALGLG